MGSIASEFGSLYSLDWTTGLDYWTGLLDWTTGLAFHNNVGYQNKGGVNKMQPNKCIYSMLS